MISVEEESPDMYENTGVYECCIFCNQETKTWHQETNTPICTDCAKSHNVREIKKQKLIAYGGSNKIAAKIQLKFKGDV